MPDTRSLPARAAMLASAAFVLLAPAARAADEGNTPDWNATTLSGDWGGLRNAWQEAGVSIEANYKLSLARNVSGGLASGYRSIGLFEARAGFDLEKLYGWSGSSAQLSVFAHHGGRPNEFLTGAYAGINNTEVDVNAVRIFQAWLETPFLDGALSARFGLYPIDSEFYVTESSALFLIPAFGMAAEVASSGPNGPSIYPVSALGLRVKLEPRAGLYVMGAVLDGVPGDPEHPHRTAIRFKRGDGAMAIVEAGVYPHKWADPESAAVIDKLALGWWRYTVRQPVWVPLGGDTHAVSSGYYLLAERNLLQSAASDGLALNGFFRHGRATDKVNPVSYSSSLGLSGTGLVPDRSEDSFGIAVIQSRASDYFRQASGAPKALETVVEISYRAQLRPWFAVQPDLQYIINPGFGASGKNAKVAQLRLEVAF